MVVGVGTFLSAMASSVVALALPTIGRELGISIELSRWVFLAYLLAVTVTLLVAGRAGDLFGLRPVYLAGFGLFGAASLACGFSKTFWMLVASRLAQGVGAAMMLAAAPALLTTAFPPARRGQALGIQSTATYIGLTVGPPLGGLVLSSLGWRWTFWFNVPIAVLVAGLGLVFLPRSRKRPPVSIDFEGLLMLLLGAPLLLLAIAEGEKWGLGSWKTWASALSGALILYAFVFLEQRQQTPLLDVKLFRSRLFSGSVLSAICNYVGLYVPTILLPFYLVEGLSISPNQAGLVLATQSLAMALVASPAGWLSDRIGSRGLATAGMLVLAGGLVGMSTADAVTPLGMVVLWQAIIGLGIGVFISPNSSALMGSAPPDQQGVAAGVLAVARNLGMLLGTAAATAVFHAAGGMTGRDWRATEFSALRSAMLLAGGVAFLGALLAATRGKLAKGERGDG